MPGGDLPRSAHQGPFERVGLDRVVRVLETASAFGHPLECEVGIGVGVVLPHRPLRLSDCGDIALEGTGSKQSSQLLPPLVIEPLLRLGEQHPVPVGGIGFATATVEGLVLDAPAALLEPGVGVGSTWKGSATSVARGVMSSSTRR